MTKTHLRGRYAAAVRLEVVGLRTVELSIVLTAMLLAVCPRAFALNPELNVSQYAHTAWRIRDGFIRGQINAIVQTPDGYLWLGTEFGLYRFDGVRAVAWQPPPDQKLPSNLVLSLLAAGDGTLWIGTDKGLSGWRDGRLTTYAALAGQRVSRLLEDHERTVWIGVYGFPIGRLYAINNGRVSSSGNDGGLGHGVLSLYEDKKGSVWVGVQDGLWRWKPGPPQFYSFPGEYNGIRGLAEDDQGALLIGTKSGIKRLLDGKIEGYPLRGTVGLFGAELLLRDRDGGLWIGTTNRGLLHICHERVDEFAMSDGLTGNLVGETPFEDREGNVWVATANGLDRFRDLAVATFSVNQGLSSPFVSAVLADRDGSVWLASGGLDRWRNGQITAFDRRNGKLKGLTPRALFQDARGRIWISTSGGAGYLEDGRFISGSVPGQNVLSFVEDTGRNLWMADVNLGLIRLSAQREVEKIPWSKLGHDVGFIDAMVADPFQAGLWLGFFQGGVAYFEDGQIRHAYGAAEGLGKGRVNQLRFGSRGALWAATEGGLSRIRNDHVVTLSSKNGLPCDTIHWSIEDNDHSVWLYAACGLVRIERPALDAWVAAAEKDRNTDATIQATVFDNSDGVRTRASVGTTHTLPGKSSDGRLWFVNLDGVSVVDPRHLPFNKLPPPVHIEQITADRKIYQVTSGGSGRVALPALLRDLQIDYTALSLVASEKVRFRYMLEGRDSNWQDAGNRRQAFYTNLPPRNYRFRVMACNNSGVWNEAGAFLDFSVAPAYYQTWWFRLSLAAALMAVLWGLYQLRLQQLAREFNAGLEARVNERTRIARELHDSLLQGFQGMMFRLQAVRDLLPGRASEAMQALDVALERGDKAIAEGRDTVSDLREPVMGDGDIAKALTALGEELAAQSGNGSVPCVRVLVEGKQRELNPMLRDEIYRIGREALRNAFRHARAQKIEAEITYGDPEFLFHVRDDGIGLAPAVADQGARAGHWGLPGMRERAKSFGGKLEVWSEHGAGTEIELVVPAAIVYVAPGAGSGARRRFWFLRKKVGVTDGKQS